MAGGGGGWWFTYKKKLFFPTVFNTLLLKDKQELSVINTMLSGEERTKGENYVSANFTRQLVELNFHEDGIYYIYDI